MPLHCIQQEGSLRAQGLRQALHRSPQPFSKSAETVMLHTCIRLSASGAWAKQAASWLMQARTTSRSFRRSAGAWLRTGSTEG